MNTIRALLISSDRDLSSELERLLSEYEDVLICRRLDSVPSTIELSRVLRANAPSLIFLAVDESDAVQAVIEHVAETMPGVQVLAVARTCTPDLLMFVMRSGVREFLAMPFQRSCLRDCLVRVRQQLEKRPIQFQYTNLIYSFLPAKPGVGATTLAVSAALAAASLPDNPTLLTDFDLNCGMVRFLLKLDSSYSVIDAVQHAPDMTEELWPQLVTKAEALDVLHAGVLNPDIRLEMLRIQHLVEFGRRCYRTICFDLSGNLEKYSLELMHDSKQVFLVVTPETPALHLAKEKLRYLSQLGLRDRVFLLLNRYTKKSGLTVAQIEQLTDAKVLSTFADDATAVNAALENGRGVTRETELGSQLAALGATMAERQSVVETRRKLSDYLSFAPSLFSLQGRRT